MNDLWDDIAYESINKFGEELCGDMVQLVKEKSETVLVLADGLGSGTKANILATLTSKIISTMIASKMSIEECVATMINTLPTCKTRGIAYSTFTIISIIEKTYARVVQYDNPKVILLRNGKNYDYPTQTHIISGKRILESTIKLQEDDVFVVFSDGALYAGEGKNLNYNWTRKEIISYLEGNYDEKATAKTITAGLLNTCNDLYINRPEDDITVATVQIRKRQVINLLFGPPEDYHDFMKMISLFFAKKGKYIVSGGTTSSLVAKYLGKNLDTSIERLDPNIPPISKLEGVDLVTEGVITISQVVDYGKDYLEENHYFDKWNKQMDGASQIARLLFNKATDINCYVGTAINPAHQNPKLPNKLNIKIQLMEELKKVLEKMGKNVNVSYF